MKGEYYDNFKKIVPIEIAQKSGVRFDANQVLQEGVIGSLVQEIKTKGFTSSDVRKIVINEGELQLPVAKIKEMVKQNEEVAQRDNARAKDIIKGRSQVTKFYNELEKENKVEVLTDTTLIEGKIKSQQNTKVEEQKKEVKAENKVEAKVENKQAPKNNTVKPSAEKSTKNSTAVKKGNTPKAPTAENKSDAKKGNSVGGGYNYSGDYSFSGGVDVDIKPSIKPDTNKPAKQNNDSGNKKINKETNDFLAGLVGGRDQVQQKDATEYINGLF